MMSMKGDGKPVSFIEDCAVPLEDLAEYTERLTEVFDKHGTTRHLVRARLGRLLHVRPIINMKQRAARSRCARSPRRRFAMVREYKGRLLGRARRRPRALRIHHEACSARASRARSRR